MKTIRYLFLGVIIILLAYGCKKKTEDSPNKPNFDGFDRTALLTNIGNQVIMPAFSDLVTQSDSLVKASNQFSNTPNLSNLNSLQNQWKNTTYTMKQCELFKFGAFQDLSLYNNLDFWPVRSADIENLINTQTNITESLLETKGATVKGFPVIEYLIFNKTYGNDSVLAKFTTSSTAVVRKTYLTALANHAKSNVLTVKSAWETTYLQSYINANSKAIDASINVTVNQMIALVDFMKSTKIGVPFGKKDGNIDVTKVEAYQSGVSWNYLAKNVATLQKTFNGGNGLGFDDFLNFLNAKYNGGNLSDAINAQFNKIQAEIPTTTTLSESILQDPSTVNLVFNDLKQLLILIKVDMISSMGLTVTFTDNDGD